VTTAAAPAVPDNRAVRIAFLGLGLIGGSIARALRGDPAWSGVSVAAWTPSGDGPRAARAAGVIDEVASGPEAALDGARLVVLCAPPLACASLVRRLGTDLRASLAAGVTVTDVASTKAALSAAAFDSGIPWVGGHPMAGREMSGFSASDAGLFHDRPWVITEAVGGGDPQVVRRLAVGCGARPVELDSSLHDRLVASISHAPLLASVALVEAVAGSGADADGDWAAASALAASGWRDATRLARGDATMGAEIAASNALPIAAVLHRYRARIDAWLEMLEEPAGPDADALRERLDAARVRLEGRD
jgi:prephenate dehydrogenase